MRSIVFLASVLLLAAPTALAVPDAGMPEASWFGLCKAWSANENGREHGNAGNAGPFAWLQEQADENDQTVEEWCAENTEHPGERDENGNGQDNGNGRGRP